MKDLLAKIEGVSALVVGDPMLDHYIWGDSERISPEAPVPVIDVSMDTYVAGGAANVALNVAALSKKTQMAGYIGRDDAGLRLRSILQEFDVRYHHCYEEDRQASTILKTRVVVRNQQLCRLDRESSPAEYIINEAGYEKYVLPCLDNVDVVILSDYAKGVISEVFVKRLIKDAKSKGVFVAMDPKPKRQIDFSGVSLLTPNRAESLQLADIHLSRHESYPYEQVCKKIWEKYHPENLIVTLGAEGMMTSREGKVIDVIPTKVREVFDVSGAGDTVIATLALALAAEAVLEDAANLANVAAGVVVGKLGTAIVKPQEILAYSSNSKDIIA
ncbi:MAG: D-glycero-beta-D-manno-heptose-7-phosphate kinase [Verrucomicrobia bacterium CG_4_10_14_3_um_filter_43_23]|nr:MAG: D-glycero-beta-D-manno-heptose-7-phosphate kinase [Verrucomicrobia bacterium CG22_combo_CG10-13_8_21_14_all_43_17]PIX57692.1 MAG: D-glycero-beta-D-manno-heptose-7-phosphate kinase [Verrucomicrobia bacterium CG_4_10_14_3_um_filter_43_23]PIY61827.1 MAG: D-glycero-beta-D-manno-heptose-7-phosphate kinase [Verrucomicrobia bacterium CG_4_10_14_0_8_um_filter_43_34]PJA44776.1 MAG: D-glycero-beta-D-manno-heptose-7-phosphate kinase [Verrucomicrobia bacterium CG_4_9_14_3_um_filter_43_20]